MIVRSDELDSYLESVFLRSGDPRVAGRGIQVYAVSYLHDAHLSVAAGSDALGREVSTAVSFRSQCCGKLAVLYALSRAVVMSRSVSLDDRLDRFDPTLPPWLGAETLRSVLAYRSRIPPIPAVAWELTPPEERYDVVVNAAPIPPLGPNEVSHTEGPTWAVLCRLVSVLYEATWQDVLSALWSAGEMPGWGLVGVTATGEELAVRMFEHGDARFPLLDECTSMGVDDPIAGLHTNATALAAGVAAYCRQLAGPLEVDLTAETSAKPRLDRTAGGRARYTLGLAAGFETFGIAPQPALGIIGTDRCSLAMWLPEREIALGLNHTVIGRDEHFRGMVSHILALVLEAVDSMP